MDFALTEEQEMFRSHIRKMLDKYEGTQVARDVILGKRDKLNEVYAKLAELGCTAINIPEQYDGLDLDALDLVPTYEELGRSLVPGLFLETFALVVPLLKKFGTEQQQKRYFPGIAAGTSWISFAALEPNADFSPEGIQCTLEKQGNQYVLNGMKIAVPEVSQATSFLIIARTNEQEKDLSLILIDKTDLLEIKKQHSLDEAKELGSLTFDQFVISEEQIIGTINEGWSTLEECLLYFNAALSSYMVGATEQIVHMAAEYAKIREQFGQAIGRFQAIKHPIVNMKVDLEIAKSLSYYANWVLETAEEDRAATVYSARTTASKSYVTAAAHNIQIHGGIGFTEEIDCHLYLKRANYYEQYLGTNTFYEEKIASSLGWLEEEKQWQELTN